MSSHSCEHSASARMRACVDMRVRAAWREKQKMMPGSYDFDRIKSTTRCRSDLFRAPPLDPRRGLVSCVRAAARVPSRGYSTVPTRYKHAAGCVTCARRAFVCGCAAWHSAGACLLRCTLYAASPPAQRAAPPAAQSWPSPSQTPCRGNGRSHPPPARLAIIAAPPARSGPDARAPRSAARRRVRSAAACAGHRTWADAVRGTLRVAAAGRLRVVYAWRG